MGVAWRGVAWRGVAWRGAAVVRARAFSNHLTAALIFASCVTVTAMCSHHNRRVFFKPRRAHLSFSPTHTHTLLLSRIRLAIPPDDDAFAGLQKGEDQFSKAMARMTSTVANKGGSIPVEITKDDVKFVRTCYEDARKGLNLYISTLNKGLEVNELKLLPSDAADYPRSKFRYTDFLKKAKQCQNRGGQTLANTWGGLMVSGYMQPSCAIPDPDQYFFQ